MISARIDASSTNIPASFTTASTSLKINHVPGANGVYVINNTSHVLVVNLTGSATSAPADASSKNIYVPENGTLSLDNWDSDGICFVRGDTEAITEGVVYIMLGRGLR